MDWVIVRMERSLVLCEQLLTTGYLSSLVHQLTTWATHLSIHIGDDLYSLADAFEFIKSRLQLYRFAFNAFKESKITEESFEAFRKLSYEIFDLFAFLQWIVGETVFFGAGIAAVLKIVKPQIDYYTKLMVDTIFALETDDEIIDYIGQYVQQRTESIDDPLERKMHQLDLLMSVVSNIAKQSIDRDYDETHTMIPLRSRTK